jgi:phosphoglycolate phosphatase
LTHPYYGIAALLETLKQQGHTLAVASNKYQAATEKIVEKLFPGIFDVVLGERENVARKPDPQIVWDILEAIGRKGEEAIEDALYIGDSLVDAETAKAAKLPFVACTWGFCTREQLMTAQAHYMADHPKEILTII